ncbi:MAG: RNA polymerase sigma factor [Caldilineaceae bacterium]|nr:RNA polymerase sigma factor [Caldilineaceae bacterium]
MTTSPVQRTIDAIWRMEEAKIIASLSRLVNDVGLAEDLAHDALVAALEQWPVEGVPDKPGAWLMTVSKRRAIDHIRRDQMAARKYDQLGRQVEIEEELGVDSFDRVNNDEVEDDLLGLIFIACHPVLSTEARVALTLRLLGGLTTEEIARAFLVPTATVAQRITRAKRTLQAAQIPFASPPSNERTARLSSVLEVIYLIFNEGYAATSGDSWVRPLLCEEALRLGRVLAELTPQDPEVHGLVALMEIQSSRLRARVGPQGEPILLLDQNRAQWDRLLINRGLAALARAYKLGNALGPYTLQAAIAACHARARTADETDWIQIAALYDALAQLTPSPIVELNRAVALGMAYGPEVGLALVDQLNADPTLADYHLLPSVRGDLLAKLGRVEEAATEFRRAAELTQNEQERQLLLQRAGNDESMSSS